MTKIITTLGPSSMNVDVLQYFKEHSVKIARLNGSHGVIDEHVSAAKLATDFGLDLMLDLPGPKIRLGQIVDKSFFVEANEKVIIKKENIDTNIIDNETGFKVLPCQFPIEKSTQINDIIYIDDGKLQFHVLKVENHRVYAQATNSGLVQSHKGINLPYGHIEIDFLTDNDLRLIERLIPRIKPKYVATSFVKTVKDIQRLKSSIKNVLNMNDGYFPEIVVKIEMAEALEKQNINKLIKECDMIMIARGDLALETRPVHIRVPFIQKDLINRCRRAQKPFIIATQILESMITCPVPTRAEISDLYRAVVLDKANYVMLSGEAAVGQYPKECVTFMHDLIVYYQQDQKQQHSIHFKRQQNRSHASESRPTSVLSRQRVNPTKKKRVTSSRQKRT